MVKEIRIICFNNQSMLLEVNHYLSYYHLLHVNRHTNTLNIKRYFDFCNVLCKSIFNISKQFVEVQIRIKVYFWSLVFNIRVNP